MPARSRIAELERQLEEAKRKALEAETSGKAESSRRVLVSHRGHVLLTESDEANQVGNESDKDLPHPHKVAWFKSSREAESVNVLAIEEPQQQQAVNIFETAEGGSGINVYHLVGFFPRPENWLRAASCILIQVFIVPAIVVYDLLDQQASDNLCPQEGDWVSKLTGIALVIYMPLTFYAEEFNFKHGWDVACIRQNAPLPRLVPLMWWVPLSVLLNILVLVFSNISVLCLIYFAETPIDMLMNALALKFITELDDMMVSKRDYKAVAILFREAAQGKELKDVSQRLKQRHFFDPVYLHPAWWWALHVLTYGLYYPVLLLLLCSPVAFYVCY